MRVEQYILDSVVYICIDNKSGERTLVGSGFCLKVNDDMYIVTARHVIEDAGFDKRYIRMRTSDGFHDLLTRQADWSQSYNADVAVIRIDLKMLDGYGTLGTAMSLDNFVDADHVYRGPPFDGHLGIDLGVGDEVVFVGLFVTHPGKSRIVPVARFGHISAMPSEPIELKAFDETTTFQASVYLVEAQSWGGHSGALAVWYTPLVPVLKGPLGEDIPIMQGQYIAGIMGLVSAHFAIKESAKVGESQSPSDIRTKLNTGMAAITPASDIHDLLMRKDVVEERQAANTKA